MSPIDNKGKAEVAGKSRERKVEAGSTKASHAKSHQPGPAGDFKAIDPAAAEKLTADEQMALYEEELKETDWGHQPC